MELLEPGIEWRRERCLSMTHFTTPHAKETHQCSLGTSWLLSSHAACSDGGVLLPAPPSALGILRRPGGPSTSQRDLSNCDVGPCPRAKTKRPSPPRRTLRCARLPGRSNPYCFSDTGWELLVSNSGHETILRGRDKRDFAFGGWADLKSGRIWAANGTIKNVPKRWRPTVSGALENHFRLFFRWH